MAAFIPGASPPLVRTANLRFSMRSIWWVHCRKTPHRLAILEHQLAASRRGSRRKALAVSFHDGTARKERFETPHRLTILGQELASSKNRSAASQVVDQNSPRNPNSIRNTIPLRIGELLPALCFWLQSGRRFCLRPRFWSVYEDRCTCSPGNVVGVAIEK